MAATQTAVLFDSIVRSQLPPPVRRLNQSQHWTRKQTRWWWWVMNAKASGREGSLPAVVRQNMMGWKAAYRVVNGVRTIQLSGSYRRTGTGVKSLGYDVVAVKDGIEVIYGTNRAYMRYVIDEENQADYHKGNWPTLQNILTTNTKALTERFGDVAQAEIEKRLL